MGTSSRKSENPGYKIQNLGDMNEELYGKVMLALSRTKSVHVA